MLSDSALLLQLRLRLLSLVHAAAGAEERAGRAATRLRWAARDRIDAAAAAIAAAGPVAGVLLWVLSICVQALRMFFSLLPSPAELQRLWRGVTAARKTVSAEEASSTTTPNRKKQQRPQQQQQRGRPPPRPATEAAVVLAEADESQLPLERVADVLEWCSKSGLERLFVFDPAGHVKRRAAQLSEELHLRRRRSGGGEEATTTLQQSWAGPLFPAASSSAPPSPSSPSLSSPSPPRLLHVHLLSGEDAEAPLLAAAAAVAVARRKEREKESSSSSKKAVAPFPPLVLSSTTGKEEAREQQESDDRHHPPSSSTSDLDAALAATRFGNACAARPQVCLCFSGGCGGGGGKDGGDGGRGGGGGDEGCLTLAGYPAWGLAQAEVYPMGSLKDASRRGVQEATERFVSTAQRFGR